MNQRTHLKLLILLICCCLLVGASSSSHDSAASEISLVRLILLAVSLIIFLMLSSFYSGSETAAVSLNKIRVNRLAEEGDKRAQIVKKLIETPERMLGLTLVGTNIANVITSEVGLLLVIALVHLPETNSIIVTKLQDYEEVIATVVTTVLILIFGEIIPKIIFRAKADALALRCAYLWRVSDIIFGGIANAATYLTNFFVKIISKDEPTSPDAQRDELRLLATMGEQSGNILKDQRRMIHSVLDLQNRTVEQVMVPLVDIVAVEKDTDIETFLNFTSESGFSRIPVYDGRIYNIIGIVHLLDVIYSNGDAKTIEPFLRTDLQFIPNSQNINVLLKEIPRSHHTMVFVVDEYGGIIGLVTVEDLIEEIVGEFSDERDEPHSIRLISPRLLECEGRAEIHTLSQQFGVPIPSGDYETIAGYILDQTGTIPTPGHQIQTDELIIIISDANARAIRKVRIQSKIGNFTQSEFKT